MVNSHRACMSRRQEKQHPTIKTIIRFSFSYRGGEDVTIQGKM